MSRKTRKLIWSAPLVAVLAVAGVLAMFVMLAPDGALAHGPVDTAAHLPPDPVTGVVATTPTVENGGRTSLLVTWNAPAAGDPVAMYRVDMSTDARIWNNVVGGELSTETLTENMATSNCDADADDEDRCYTVGELMPGTTYHFRVFAMNYFGTSRISIDETIGTGKTLSVDPPDAVAGLTATTYFTNKIVLDWQAPADTGGADVVWYCLAIASSPSGPFDDLARDTTVKCLEATKATAAAVANDKGVYTSPEPITTLVDVAQTDAPQTIVVAATDDDDNPVTRYEHLGLHTPGILALRYRVYAVTDDNGETVGGRRIALAASNTATGRTVAPADTAPARARAPQAPGQLRVVAYGSSLTDAGTADDTTDDTLGSPVLSFYWNTPGNFPSGDTDNPRNWVVQVARAIPDGKGGSTWEDVNGIPQALDAVVTTEVNAPAQFVATPNGANPITLLGNTADGGYFRVRYVNPGPDDAGDIVGAPAYVRLQTPLDGNDHIASTITESTLPIITKAARNGNGDNQSGLRFVRNPTDAKRRIDLKWQRDVNANSVESRQRPTGYVIDRSDDGGKTWQSLFRATQPENLGTATTYTDANMSGHDVTPGKRYTYRVFPVGITPGFTYQDDFGLPGQIDASAEEATVPVRVEGLRVTADGQTKLKLEWSPVSAARSGGHPIKGYLVQVSDNDLDNDGDLRSDATWENVDLNADDIADNADDVITVGTNVFKYPYNPVTTADPPVPILKAGFARWFRVIAITNENDGLPNTGGNQVDITDGTLDIESPSTGEESPTDEDEQIALPKRGMTATLGDPDADTDPTPPEKPVDLTAEAASDTNALGDGNRGVFLTWNEVKVKATDTRTTTYKIERMRMNTSVDALNDTAWQFIGRATDDTSFTDPLPLRQNEETRMYRVGSEATSILGVVFVDDPGVMYALHPDMHMPSMPQMVTAAADSDTAITVSWAIPADNGGSDITGYMVQSAYMGADGMMTVWMDVDPAHMGMDMMYMDMGLMPDTMYYYRVRAVNAAGYSDWAEAMATTLAPVSTVPSSPSNVMATDTTTNPADLMITVTWTDGENVEAYGIVLFNSDFSEWPYIARGMEGSHTFSVDAGSYVAVVVALNADGTLLTDANGDYLFGPGNAVTIGGQ